MLCIILLIITMICMPILCILTLSPIHRRSSSESDYKALIYYQLLFVIPSVICYVVLASIDKISINTSIIWIGYILCLLHLIYFLAKVQFSKIYNDRSCLMYLLMNLSMIFLLIVLVPMIEIIYLLPLLVLLSATLPVYNVYLMIECRKWLQESVLLRMIQDSDVMDVLYCCQHNAFYHKEKVENPKGIIDCMNLHRNWQKLSVQQKHRKLKSSLGIKYILNKLWIIIMIINMMIPLIISMWQCMKESHERSSKIMILCGIYVISLMILLHDEYPNLVTVWTMSDIVLIQMIEQLIPRDEHYKRSKIKCTLDHMALCDVIKHLFPEELINILIEYLTNDCGRFQIWKPNPTDATSIAYFR